MFGKTESSHAPGSESPAAGAPSTTVIGPGSRVVGDLFGDEDIVINGRLEGKIRVARDVEVGPTGEIQGDVEARAVLVGGKIRGQVLATERAELASSAVLQGSLQAPKIIIAEGAQLEGQVAMTGVEPQPAESKNPEG